MSVLDDYQSAAHRFADWASLGDDTDCRFIREHLCSFGFCRGCRGCGWW